MNRRSFLTRMAGFGALAALPTLGMRRAVAADDAAPRRLLLWFQPNGYGEDPYAVHQRSLSRMGDLASKITYVRGTHLDATGTNHEDHMEQMLNGGSGASFDQQVAQYIAADPETRTNRESIMLGVRPTDIQHGSHCSFIADGQIASLQSDPSSAWSLIFDDLDTGNDPEAQAALEQLWSRRDTIMTRNQLAAESMRSRLASGQRERLDQYISSIDEIREQMTSLADTTEACTVPTQPEAAQNSGGFQNYHPITNGHISLMSHALSCDLSRVGLIQFNRSTSKVDFQNVIDGSSFSNDHHGLTHDGGSEDQITTILDWYDDRFLDLLTALDSRTDIDGNTVLDNTLVVRITEVMLSNSHRFEEGHHLIAGGGNFFRTGEQPFVSNGDPLAKLWKTLAHAVGAEMDTVAGYSGDIYSDMLI